MWPRLFHFILRSMPWVFSRMPAPGVSLPPFWLAPWCGYGGAKDKEVSLSFVGVDGEDTSMMEATPAPFECAKCRHGGCEADDFHGIGGLVKFFDVQNKKFTTVSCTRCGYTEPYRGDKSMLSNVFDFIFSGSGIHDGPLGLCKDRRVSPAVQEGVVDSTHSPGGETSYSTMQSLGSGRFLPQSFTVLVQ